MRSIGLIVAVPAVVAVIIGSSGPAEPPLADGDIYPLDAYKPACVVVGHRWHDRYGLSDMDEARQWAYSYDRVEKGVTQPPTGCDAPARVPELEHKAWEKRLPRLAGACRTGRVEGLHSRGWVHVRRSAGRRVHVLERTAHAGQPEPDARAEGQRHPADARRGGRRAGRHPVQAGHRPGADLEGRRHRVPEEAASGGEGAGPKHPHMDVGHVGWY